MANGMKSASSFSATEWVNIKINSGLIEIYRLLSADSQIMATLVDKTMEDCELSIRVSDIQTALMLSSDKNAVDVEIELAGQVSHDGSHMVIINAHYMSAYPNLNQMLETDNSLNAIVKLSGKHLKQGLKRGFYAMGVTDCRRYLNGTYLELKDDKMNVVSSDGHRLSWSTIDMFEKTIVDPDASEFKTIIPRDSVKLLGNIVPDDQLSIEFCSDDQINISFDEIVMFTSKSLDSRYPTFERVYKDNLNIDPVSIKTDFKKLIEVLKEWKKLLKINGLTYKDKNGIKCGTGVVILVSEVTVNMFLESMNVVAHTFKNGTYNNCINERKCFDIDYLIDALSNNKGIDTIEFHKRMIRVGNDVLMQRVE